MCSKKTKRKSNDPFWHEKVIFTQGGHLEDTVFRMIVRHIRQLEQSYLLSHDIPSEAYEKAVDASTEVFGEEAVYIVDGWLRTKDGFQSV